MKVRQVERPGRYADGNGLYLVVDPSGAKRWMLRTIVHGTRRDIGLGGLSLVSLAEAREKAIEYRKLARAGGDPIAEKRSAQRTIPTFRDAAKKVHGEHEPTWKNAKHGQQWINTLEQYAYPEIGDKRVDHIDTPDILRILSPIWLTKAETARRVRQRIASVFDWAKAAGHRTGDNPVEGVTRGLPKQSERKGHHEAMRYSDVPAFVKKLRATNSELGKLAFEFLILTAARTSEVLEARWDEIDIDQKLWTVPPARMKAKREHRVPLSDRCLAILETARPMASGSPYLFRADRSRSRCRTWCSCRH